MQRRTKIICTMGPSVCSPEAIRKLIRAGMNVARLNFSHGTHESHGEVIARLKQIRASEEVPLAIMLDTKGPEIRVGAQWKERHFQAGERIQLGSKTGQIPVRPLDVLSHLQPDMQVLFDDGYLMARVVHGHEGEVEIEFSNEGVLKPNKSMTLPGTRVPLPALTEQDIEDLRFGAEQGIDLVSASFVRSAQHVMEIRELLHRLGAGEVQIIAKIENAEGIQNFDEIVQVADGIMVARGDLGVALPVAQVPRLQKMMIRKCLQAGKPVVTATQMLESMIHNPRPTRAEVSDVANAIYDSTSAVMLSGETAMGNYPLEAVHVMSAVIEETERDLNVSDRISELNHHLHHEIPSAVAIAAVETAVASHARAIFAFTRTGGTARLLSRLRPHLPILAFVPEERRYHQMALLWGVEPFLATADDHLGAAFRSASESALARHAVRPGDLVVVTAGAPFGQVGTTNSMIVETIGRVLLRGKGVGAEVMGVLRSWHAGMEGLSETILWVEDWTPAIAEDAVRSRGVVFTKSLPDPHKERAWLEWGQEHHHTVIVQAHCPHPLFEQGQRVRLEGRRGLVLPQDLGES